MQKINVIITRGQRDTYIIYIDLKRKNITRIHIYLNHWWMLCCCDCQYNKSIYALSSTISLLPDKRIQAFTFTFIFNSVYSLKIVVHWYFGWLKLLKRSNSHHSVFFHKVPEFTSFVYALVKSSKNLIWSSA